MAPFPSLRLIYFDFGGRAEAIRVALHVGKVPFEDVRITEQEFSQQKAGTYVRSMRAPRCMSADSQTV